MYALEVFEKARALFAIREIPFLTEMRHELQKNPLLKGLTILHNTPLTLATAFKLEVLAFGGAKIVATCIKALPPEQRAVELLQAANIPVQIEHVFHGDYDIHLDCCGELIVQKPPRIGAVELTQTGSEIYRKTPIKYPIVSVDDSKLKIIETFFGTGDGFIRALQLVKQNDIYNKAYVVFGYGKVGRGIVHALKKITSNITIVDHIKPPLFPKDLKFINTNNLKAIRKAISESFAVVTASGIKGLITNFYCFTKSDFGQSILINMGAEDEYGNNFSLNDIEFEKKPFNFVLQEPTAYRYLDPIFYAHNLSIDLIRNNAIQNGYHSFPETIAQSILKRWESLYKEDINEALSICT